MSEHSVHWLKTVIPSLTSKELRDVMDAVAAEVWKRDDWLDSWTAETNARWLDA